MSGDRVGSSCEQTALSLLYMNLLQKQRGCIHNKIACIRKKPAKKKQKQKKIETNEKT